MNRLMMIAALLCFGIASTVSAADAEKKKKKAAKKQGPDIAALFNKLDVNQDKKIDKKEFEAFTGLMADAKAKKAKKAKQVVAKADDAADAKAKKKAAKKAAKTAPTADLAKNRAEWFKKLDANNDGSLTLEEFTKIKEVIAADEPAAK